MLQQAAKHHNKIQFFGYEVANIVLVAQQLLTSDDLSYGINAETAGALFFYWVQGSFGFLILKHGRISFFMAASP